MTETRATQATTTHCLRCGRRLTSLKSIALGLGPTCQRKVTAAAQASTDKPAQVTKALELIETGGIVAIHHGRAYRVVGSNGIDQYLCGAGNCNCPAGLHGRRCYHVLATELAAAVPAPAKPATDPFACFPAVNDDLFADAA